jgi:hypothetical protein
MVGLLPRVDKANDGKRSRELCAAIRPGEIAVFDKAYLDFDHLCDLLRRGVFWVTRAEESMAYQVIDTLPLPGDYILRDELIPLTTITDAKDYPEVPRRGTALVKADGKERAGVPRDAPRSRQILRIPNFERSEATQGTHSSFPRRWPISNLAVHSLPP